MIVWFGIAPAWAATFAVLGDAGEWNDRTRLVQRSILKAGVKALILPGDNLYRGFFSSATYEGAWAPWRQAGFTFDVVAIGNHHGGYRQEMAYFGMPREYYAHVLPGRARFLVLNSDDQASAEEQSIWLERELDRAQEPFVFLVYHHPSFKVSKHDWHERERFQRALRPLLKKYRTKLTALLVGHDHVAALASFDGLPVVVSGAVHEVEKPRAIAETQDGVRVSVPWVYDGRHTYWAKLEVGAKARVEYVRASDGRVSCAVSLVTGQPLQPDPNCRGRD